MNQKLFDWATSMSAGNVTEVAVLAPIRRGSVPNERRTYEERAISVIDNFAGRVKQGLPNELNLVPSIHFGRIMLLRPEHYLMGSNIPQVTYEPDLRAARAGPRFKIPKPIDEYVEVVDSPGALKAGEDLQLRSFLLTTVEFDGDLRVYFRDIGVQLGQRFNLIFENCEGFPGTSDLEAFWLWIRRFQMRTQLFYAANPNLTVARIKQLEAFRRNFDLFVARVRGSGTPPVRSLDDLFDEFLNENMQFAEGFPNPSGLFRAMDEGSAR